MTAHPRGRTVRESAHQKQRRYREAMLFIGNLPDSEAFWGPARTALSRIATTSYLTIAEAWSEECEAYGIREEWR